VNAGVLLFHWLVAFCVDVSLWEGVTCVYVFRRPKLALVFWENPPSLDELIGYVEWTVFREIWPERLLIDKERKVSANSLILNIFLVVASNATCYANFFDIETCQIYKKITNGKKKENADTLWEINALWLTMHSYFAWMIAFDTWLIHWNCSRLICHLRLLLP